MLEPAATEAEQPTEAQRVIFRRFAEARAHGLTLVEARIFAEGSVDIGMLRRLVRGGCPPALAARILN